MGLCMSHLGSNAGNSANFVCLDGFWALLQRIFPTSYNAKLIWFQLTSKTWKLFSKTKWFGKHDVLKMVHEHFSMLAVAFQRLILEGVCPATAGKALAMLEKPGTRWLLAIEICAMVEGLAPLYKMVYDLEGDGHLIFKVGIWLRRIRDELEAGQDGVPVLPSVGPLIVQAVQWMADHPDVVAAVAAAQPTRAEVLAAAGPRPRAADWPVAASDLSAAANNARTQFAVAVEQWEARVESVRIEAAEKFQCPHDEASWRNHIQLGIGGAYNYFLTGLGGERAHAIQLYEAVAVCIPSVAVTLTQVEADAMIDSMRVYDRLDDDVFTQSLKDGFLAFKYYAQQLGADAEVDILQWHYSHQEVAPDDIRGARERCPICTRSQRAGCTCVRALKAWYRAVKLLVLLQPSSAAAERVFSVLKRFWDDQQVTSLSDAIKASIFLEVNMRHLV